MYGKIKDHLQQELKSIKEAGLYKNERIITSAQDAEIAVSSGEQVLNFCANNYLGLSNHPALIQAAKDAMDSHGYGMSSVRFICGTQDLHKELEKQIADFLVRKIPYCMQPVSMPMGECLSLYLQLRMPSFRMR